MGFNVNGRPFAFEYATKGSEVIDVVADMHSHPLCVMLNVASRMIIRPFYKQMRMRSVPVFHGPHRGFALECRLG
jgi:hypothetical protein